MKYFEKIIRNHVGKNIQLIWFNHSILFLYLNKRRQLNTIRLWYDSAK